MKKPVFRIALVAMLVGLVALAAMPVAANGAFPAVFIYGRVRDITNDKGVSVATPAGDPVDAAAVVELVKPSGDVVSSSAVDYNGDFLFSLPVQPGLYTVRVASVPANYGAQLVGTRLNPDQGILVRDRGRGSMLSAAFLPGVSQVPVVVTTAGWYGFIDFEYTAGAKAPEDCQTPSWSYIHGVIVLPVIIDGVRTEWPLPNMPLQLMFLDGGTWVPVYRPNGDRVFFRTSDRGIYGVGIRYVPGTYAVLGMYPPGTGPMAVFTLNPCGTDNTVPNFFWIVP